jgi:type IV pilus assembly protein PilC
MTGNQHHHYSWRGIDLQGQPQQGISSAATPELLRAQYYAKGILITHIKTAAKLTTTVKPLRPPPGQLSMLLRQCAGLLKAGLALVQALDISIECLPASRLRTEMCEALGRSALSEQTLLISMIKAAEQSGTLDHILGSLADDQEKTEQLRARVKKALIYPLTVLLVALLVTALLLIKVVPQFASTFTSLGAELPALTQSVMMLSDIAIDYALPASATAISLVLLLRAAISRYKVLHRLLDRLLLWLPLTGTIVRNACLCRFSRTLAGSLRAGVPLLQALESTAAATGNHVYQTECLKIRQRINEGHPLSFGVRKNRLFPVMIAQLVYAGEQSGTLDQMLHTCAARYEQAVDQSVDVMSSMIEPIVMTVLGVIVAILMLAMYLPVFRLGAVL